MQLQLGSGKTAVLVERIIRKIIDDKVDIDKILVVTFTNAAASEMRERILDAIYKKIEESEGTKRAVADYIAGMSDDYCLATFNKIYVPKFVIF